MSVKILTEQLYCAVSGKEYKTNEDSISEEIRSTSVLQKGDWLIALIQSYCPDLCVTEESRLKEDLAVDSLNMYEIACKIEEKMQIDITQKLGESVTVHELRELISSEKALHDNQNK